MLQTLQLKEGASLRVAIGAAAFIVVMGVLVAIAANGSNNDQRVLEATVQMERLATKLEHAKKIAPETKLEIDRLVRHPWHDCNEVACRKTLEMRNRAAREHLQAVLAGSKAPTELSARRTKVEKAP